jgi:exonuclease III
MNRISTLTTKITGSNNDFSLMSLNINGLNSPIKRHRLTNWLHKQDPNFCCLQETNLRDKGRHNLRIKGWKTIFQANGPKKQARVIILISNKIDFQTKVSKKIRRDTSYSSKVKFTKMTLDSEHLCFKCKGIHIY